MGLPAFQDLSAEKGGPASQSGLLQESAEEQTATKALGFLQGESKK